MSGVKATAVATLVIGTLILGGQRAGATTAPNPPPGPPSLSTSYDTVGLSGLVTATTCGQIYAAKGQFGSGCIHAHGPARARLRLDQRVKAPFRGTVTLTLPENTDSVFIGYARRPATEYSTRPTVIWSIPGSGTYNMHITLKWHDEFTTSEATYLVPLWVPRTT